MAHRDATQPVDRMIVKIVPSSHPGYALYHHPGMFLLLSVMGTGTHFAMEFFKRLGLNFSGKHNPDGEYYQLHTEGGLWNDIDFPTLFKRAVIPLRHPFLSYNTRSRVSNVTIEEMAAQWDLLMVSVPRLEEHVFLPVEVSRQHHRPVLYRVAEFVGADIDDPLICQKIDKFAEDWPPVAKGLYRGVRPVAPTVLHREDEWRWPGDIREGLADAAEWYWSQRGED